LKSFLIHVREQYERGPMVITTVSTVDEKFLKWFVSVAEKAGYIVDVETIGEKVRHGS
jgi:hypothetical protein